jgi:predicted DNA-binding transcriptional regulator AlpA
LSRRPKLAPDNVPQGHITSLADKPSTQSTDRLALRLGELAKALGISRRTLERERSAGRFPMPDFKIGKAPLWRPGTVQAWIEEQSEAARKEGSR